MTATIEDNIVATLEFSEYNDEPYVNMIKVNEKYRRKGIGTKLLKQLQEMFPNNEIHMGMETEEGAKLIESLPKKFIPNERYNELSSQRNQLKNRMEELQNFLDTATPDTQRKEMLSKGEEWNQINDKLWDIEKELEDLKPGKTILA